MALRKKVEIIIVSCNRCPHAIYKTEGAICGKTGEFASRHNEIGPQIPDWCPLEDA